MYVCWFKQNKILISQHSPPQFKYFAYQNGPKGGPNENEFRYFSNTKMNITSSYSSKRRWKNGAICLVSFLIFWVMVLKLPKMVQFLPIWDNLSKESKSIGSLYSYASERPHYALSENSMFYRVWAPAHKILRNEISKKYWRNRNLTKFIKFKR